MTKKYQVVINKRESTGLNHFDDHKFFTKYFNNTIKVKNIKY